MWLLELVGKIRKIAFARAVALERQTYKKGMPARSKHPSQAFDVRPTRRVPIAMTVALEIVAELRARERVTAQRIMNELLSSPPPPRRQG